MSLISSMISLFVSSPTMSLIEFPIELLMSVSSDIVSRLTSPGKILLFRVIDIFNSNGKTIYLNHTWYLHGPMVPGRGWLGGQCWVPWSGSSLLHNWSCGPRGHWTRRRQPPHLCCAPPQLSRAFISTIDCGSGSGSGYYHSSTPADYCMTGAGHRLLSPFTLNPAY